MGIWEAMNGFSFTKHILIGRQIKSRRNNNLTWIQEYDIFRDLVYQFQQSDGESGCPVFA